MDGWLEYLNPQELTTMAVAYVPKIVAAVVVFLLVWLVLKLTRKPLAGGLRKADFAEPLVRLLVDNLYRYTLLILAVVMALKQLGLDVGAALAGIGVVGIALGFAAQDSLANIIAGFLIFWDKPFQVGHYVTAQGHYGEVVNITLRTTRIRTRQNTYLIVPNQDMIDSAIVNHSMYGETRVDVPVGIGYAEDIEAARRALLAAAKGVEDVMEDPAPAVVVTELGDSSVNLQVRVWIRDASREKPVFTRVIEAAKRSLDEAGIEIPYPHLQLYLDDVEAPVWEKAQRLLASG